MPRATDIMPITEFTRAYQKAIRELKKHGRPKILTVDGKASVVVQDAAAYEESFELLDAIYVDMMVDRALADKRPTMTVAELRDKLGLKKTKSVTARKRDRRAA